MLGSVTIPFNHSTSRSPLVSHLIENMEFVTYERHARGFGNDRQDPSNRHRHIRNPVISPNTTSNSEIRLQK